MSSTIFWEPGRRKKTPCNYALKQILQKKYQFPTTLYTGSLDYLDGLADAGIEGAAVLGSAIIEYGSIDLTEEY
jgi:hypothetical protein